jgi:molybdopterin synthase sulfur carrier subunit
MKVAIPSPLRSYTGSAEVEGEGVTLGGLLYDLDRRYPGFRFRIVSEQDLIRPHVRIFVDGEQVFDLDRPLEVRDAVVIVQALSGG